jgi:hypothetical protein
MSNKKHEKYQKETKNLSRVIPRKIWRQSVKKKIAKKENAYKKEKKTNVKKSPHKKKNHAKKKDSHKVKENKFFLFYWEKSLQLRIFRKLIFFAREEELMWRRRTLKKKNLHFEERECQEVDMWQTWWVFIFVVKISWKKNW